jgi:hypothetical protein
LNVPYLSGRGTEMAARDRSKHDGMVAFVYYYEIPGTKFPNILELGEIFTCSRQAAAHSSSRGPGRRGKGIPRSLAAETAKSFDAILRSPLEPSVIPTRAATSR